MVTKKTGAIIAVVLIVIIVVAGVWYWTTLQKPKKLVLRIMVVDWDWGPWFQDNIADMYEEYTNGEVSIQVDIQGYDKLHEKVMAEWSAHSSYYDIIPLDSPYWSQPVAKDWVYCLEDMENEHPDWPRIHWENYPDSSFAGSIYEGKKWANIILWSTTGVYYRTDLFEQYNISDPWDWNWDDFRGIAETLTLDTNDDGTVDIYGTALINGAQEPGWSDWSFRQMGYGQVDPIPNFWETWPMYEGFVFDHDAKPLVDVYGVQALDRLIEVLPYCPPGTLSFDYGDVSSLFYEGKIAMVPTWCDVFADYNNPDVSSIVGKVGFAPMPHDGPKGWQMIGYHALTVNKFSKHPEETYKFLAWISNNDVSHVYDRMADDGLVTLVMKKHMYEAPYNTSRVHLEVFRKLDSEHGLIGHPRYPEFIEVQRIVWEEVAWGLAGTKTSQQAIDDMYDRIYALMEDAGYYG